MVKSKVLWLDHAQFRHTCLPGTMSGRPTVLMSLCAWGSVGQSTNSVNRGGCQDYQVRVWGLSDEKKKGGACVCHVMLSRWFEISLLSG